MTRTRESKPPSCHTNPQSKSRVDTRHSVWRRGFQTDCFMFRYTIRLDSFGIYILVQVGSKCSRGKTYLPLSCLGKGLHARIPINFIVLLSVLQARRGRVAPSRRKADLKGMSTSPEDSQGHVPNIIDDLAAEPRSTIIFRLFVFRCVYIVSSDKDPR